MIMEEKLLSYPGRRDRNATRNPGAAAYFSGMILALPRLGSTSWEFATSLAILISPAPRRALRRDGWHAERRCRTGRGARIFQG